MSGPYRVVELNEAQDELPLEDCLNDFHTEGYDLLSVTNFSRYCWTIVLKKRPQTVVKVDLVDLAIASNKAMRAKR